MAFAIVVEGKTVSELAGGIGLRRGRALEVVTTILRESLDLYVMMAGWRPADHRIRRAEFPSKAARKSRGPPETQS